MTDMPPIRSPNAATCLIFLGIGTVLAVLLLPPSPRSEEEFQLTALVFALGLLGGPLGAARRSPAVMLDPISLLLLGLCYWLVLDLLQGSYVPEVSHIESVIKALVAIALFASGLCIAQFGKAPILPAVMKSAAEAKITSTQLFGIGLTAFLIAFTRFAIPVDFDLIEMYEALSLTRFEAPWQRGRFGGWDAFLDHLSYFGYILPPLAVLHLRLKGLASWRSIVLVLATLIITLLIAQGGGRRIVGAMLISAGLVWVLTSPKPGRTIVLAAVLGVPLLLVLMQYMLLTRGGNRLEEWSLSALFTRGIHVDDNFNRLSQIIELVPDTVPHVSLQWVVWLIVRPIPRVIWPEKPEGFGFDLAAHLGMENVTLTSSIVGETYLAFGLLGCFCAGLVFGYLARVVRLLLAYRNQPGGVLQYSVAMLALFVALRSGVELVLFGYALISLILLFIVFKPRASKALNASKAR